MENNMSKENPTELKRVEKEKEKIKPSLIEQIKQKQLEFAAILALLIVISGAHLIGDRDKKSQGNPNDVSTKGEILSYKGLKSKVLERYKNAPEKELTIIGERLKAQLKKIPREKMAEMLIQALANLGRMAGNDLKTAEETIRSDGNLERLTRAVGKIGNGAIERFNEGSPEEKALNQIFNGSDQNPDSKTK